MPESVKPELIEKVSLKLTNLSLMLATAKSCTGGMIAAALTDRPGASNVFERGFVTYSNQAKSEMLGVAPEILKQHGAVSPQVAMAMARGALKHSRADVALSVTGIAGPDGGTPDKPVGLVYIGFGSKQGDVIQSAEHRFTGDRAAIRKQSAEAALTHLLKFLNTLA